MNGPTSDHAARTAAAAAQSDADALEALIALRASRIRLYSTVSQGLVVNTHTKITLGTIHEALGVFSDHAAANEITIPEGVSKVRVRYSAYIGGGTSGSRVVQLRRYRGTEFSIVADFRAASPSNGGTYPVAGISCSIDVQAGDRIEAWAVVSATSSIAAFADSMRNSTYLEAEVLE